MGNLISSTTVAQLGRNDPNVKAVTIRLRQERDAPLAEALERNDYVNEICFETEQQQDQPQLLPAAAFAVDSVTCCLLLLVVLFSLVRPLSAAALVLWWVMLRMAPLVLAGYGQQDQPQQQRWENLRRVLATRKKLEKVHFRGPEPADGSPIITLEHASIILQAVQQNRFVRSARFTWFNLASGGVVCSFLEDASSLTEFHLEFCSMTEQGAERITASLQRNTNLQTLGLRLADSHLELVLPCLETNTCLRSLSLDTLAVLTPDAPPVGIEQRLQQLLQRTPSIQCVEFKRVFIYSDEIFQGLIRNTTVSTIKFNCCQFGDARTVDLFRQPLDLFRQMIETKPNLQHLRIKYCHFPEDSRLFLGATLQAVLVRPHSPLRTLEVIQIDLSLDFPNLTFGALLRAVGRSGLECFRIGIIQSEEQFETLLSSLPSMKVRELEFHLDGPFAANRQGDVLRAAKQNFSLRSLKASFGGRFSFDDDGFDGFDFFTDEDNKRMQFYFDLNERLARWVANPATVPRLLWPKALALALESGEGTLYGSLLALSGHALGPMQGNRMRKRRGKKDKTV